MRNQQKANAALVESLESALRSGDHGLKTVPALLKRIVREESWREFVTQRGELVEHNRFIDFVTRPPLKGLGATVDLLRRIISDDTEALDLLDQALQNPSGGDRRSHDAISVDNINADRPDGTSRTTALRRLRKDAPELHAEVLAGRLSAHAAMVKAGFRPKTFTIRSDRPDSIVKTLRKNLSPEQLAELRKLLNE